MYHIDAKFSPPPNIRSVYFIYSEMRYRPASLLIDCACISGGDMAGANYAKRLLLGGFSILFALNLSTLAFGASLPQMVTTGQAGVSASGAFTYSIPVIAPPGTGGMTPDLSIDYASGGSAGTLGLGWALNGLSTITRCPRTTAQDGIHGGVNYDANDRFCLDGQRLIAISGTYGGNSAEYRTELNYYTKIISNGTSGTGPTYFKVWLRSGRILEFGNTADSRVQPAGTTVREWALNKITDAAGNYLTVTYNSAAGTDRTANSEIYPVRIDYTGNATTSMATYNSVQFSYTARNSAAIFPVYKAGYGQKKTVLLSDIRTYSGSTLVTDYKIAYTLATSGAQNDELTSITQCDGSVSPVCLPSVSFTWQGSRDTLGYSTSTNNLSFLGSIPAAFMDINGDGLLDVVGGLAYNGTTYTPSCPAGGDIFLGSTAGTFSASGMTIDSTGTACAYGASTHDINGDGLADLFELGGSIATTTSLLVNNGAGHLSTGGTVPGGLKGLPNFTDLNGDGKVDWFKGSVGAPQYGNGDGTFTIGTNLSITSDYLSFGDFDGDGCADILARDVNSTSGSLVRYMCNPAVTSISSPTFSTATALVTGDFNGDGLEDVLVLNATCTLYLSSGTGFVSYSVSFGFTPLLTSVAVGDWNGDGRQDVAIRNSSNQELVYLSTGTGFVQSLTISGVATSPAAIDWNNDGVRDLILAPTGSSDTEYVFAYVPEYVHSIDNGLGAVTTVTYDRLNKNGTFYSKGTGATYPVQDQDGPTYVVSSVSSPSGIGGTYVVDYSYAGKKTDIAGHGALGFSQIVQTDAQTGSVKTTNYRTDFPYNGFVASETVTSGATTLSSTINTYGLTTLTGISSTHYYNILLSQSVQSQTDLDGSSLPSVTTSYTYDTYENPLTVTRTVSDGSSSAMTNTFSNDTTHWILGQLTSSTTTNIVP